MPADEPKRKARKKTGNPYDRTQRPKVVKPTHATSAIPLDYDKRKNLTCGDWLTVFAYVDQHPNMKQEDIVQHFATRREGVLRFTQSSLSRRLGNRDKLEEQAHAHPNALSMKRA
ncbi:hypothetical protein ARMSODRAFT_1019995 [Armillaria solidipes]|uniref:Uncharacterized protein n=1 Tax=Armillaria solidipes TaxID=1076256 RepID=A0A2H3BLT6_9AGAR|nr:hypothetical protein ARMSODRAFT_1019995 [Armillaria solidipes]